MPGSAKVPEWRRMNIVYRINRIVTSVICPVTNSRRGVLSERTSDPHFCA